MFTNPFSLSGKTILVTGASSGIGRGIALQCAGMGGQMILTGRDENRLAAVKAGIQDGKAVSIIADQSKDEDLLALSEALPVLDGIVLNAGLLKTTPVGFIKRENFEELFNTNLFGPALLVKHLLKQRKIRKGGSVCFISSIAAQYVHPGNAVYGATKGAVNSFTRSLALELAPKGIRVNAILPGMIETSLMDESPIDKEHLLTHVKNYPLGRFGQPLDVANLAIYLLSEASVWMTGSLLTLDGGYSLK